MFSIVYSTQNYKHYKVGLRNHSYRLNLNHLYKILLSGSCKESVISVITNCVNVLLTNYKYLQTPNQELLPLPPSILGPRADFRLSAQPQKFETIAVTIGYENWQLLCLHVILAPARALDPWRWPRGSQFWGRECPPPPILKDDNSHTHPNVSV